MDDKLLKDIVVRLNALISIGLDTPAPEKPSMVATKIERLSSLGLASNEIGDIIGKPTNYVTAVLSKIKNRRK